MGEILNHKEHLFRATHDGKCGTCNDKKPLDSMVLKYSKDHPNNIYECLDCKIDFENTFKEKDNYEEHKQTLIEVLDDEYVSNVKMKNLIMWCFG